jgi:S1-C subfamily serine protease
MIPKLTAAGLMAGFMACAPTLAWAQSQPEQDRQSEQSLAQLERSLRGLAEQTIPKTVLIKAIAGPGRVGSGSGAIISPDGYILTCTHVVEIGKTLEVVTSDGKTYQAKLLGHNKRQDYSLIKIEARGLATFEMGDSDAVRKGDWVAALGHPGGPYKDVQPAFAAGRVRGLDMQLPVGFMKKFYNHAIMTDVPIFAGDSGGPLVNLKGELVGINGAIVMINEMAFAIPMNQIKKDLAALKAGKVIEGEPPGPDAFKQMQKVISPEDYKKMTGRMFKNFGKLFGGQDNPLSKLFGGKDNPFSKMFGGQGENPFGKMFGEGAPDMGKMFKDLFGGDGEMDLSKLLDPDGPLGKMFGGGGGGDMEKMLKDLFGGQGKGGPDMGKMFKDLFGGQGKGGPDMGKMFKDLFGGKKSPFSRPAPTPSSGKRVYLGLRIASTGDVGGLLIESVQPKGPADKGGLRKGDLLVAVNGKSVASMAALKKSLSGKSPGQSVTLKVLRTQFLDTEIVERQLKLKVVLGSR